MTFVFDIILKFIFKTFFLSLKININLLSPFDWQVAANQMGFVDFTLFLIFPDFFQLINLSYIYINPCYVYVQ